MTLLFAHYFFLIYPQKVYQETPHKIRINQKHNLQVKYLEP